ncbi:hypothetical protein MTO96_019465 [Rhipicephalus appendiculatus]
MLNTSAMKSIGAEPWSVIFAPCREAGSPWSEGYIECLFRHMGLPGLAHLLHGADGVSCGGSAGRTTQQVKITRKRGTYVQL